jgi:CrcB protein
MNLANVLAVALGGALGSVGRFLVGVGATKLFGFSFPWGTLIINVVGSFALGIFAEMFALKLSESEAVRAFLTIGICGGFTTFSTFSLDAVTLMNRGATLAALLYAIASVVLSIAGLYAGLRLTRMAFV